MRRYATKHFVTLKKRVERLEVADRFRRERPPHVLAHEAPEPFAQGARLVGDLIQFAGRRLLDQRVQRLRRNKVGLSQPRDEAVAAVEPVNWLIDRRRDRVEEVEARKSAMKNAGGLCGTAALRNQMRILEHHNRYKTYSQVIHIVAT